MAEPTEILRGERDVVVEQAARNEFCRAPERPARVFGGFADLMRRPSVFPA